MKDLSTANSVMEKFVRYFLFLRAEKVCSIYLAIEEKIDREDCCCWLFKSSCSITFINAHTYFYLKDIKAHEELDWEPHDHLLDYDDRFRVVVSYNFLMASLIALDYFRGSVESIHERWVSCESYVVGGGFLISFYFFSFLKFIHLFLSL